MNEEVNFCDQCGSKINSDAKFCSNCGCDLKNSSTQIPLDEKVKLETVIGNPDHDPPSLDTDMPWELPTGMTDQLLENQNQKPEKEPEKKPQKTPPPIWVPITLVICFHIYGLLHSFNWEVARAIFTITKVPSRAIFDTLGYNLAFSIGLIHLAISQFFESKRNSYSRRYIIIFWTIASFFVFLTQEVEDKALKGMTQQTIVPLKNPAQRTPLPGPLGGDLEQFQTLVHQIPNDPRAHEFLGNAYKSLGRYKEAIASYKEALRIEPNYVMAHGHLGDAYTELGQHKEAIAPYKEALRRWPDYVSAHNGLGNAYKNLGQYKEAITSYKEALRFDNYFNTHLGLGNTYTELGQYKEAIASYKEALSINPKSTTVRNLLNNLEQKTAYGIEKNTEND